ncbi:hypothetical protein E4U41_001091 [Claviceps citrina]|nr:hypothetical protein E4U41_001091 [Claviceps citrina]
MRLMAYATGCPLNAAYVVARYPRACKPPTLYGHKPGKVVYDLGKGRLFWMTQAAGDSLLREHERQRRETRRPASLHEHHHGPPAAQQSGAAEPSEDKEDVTASADAPAEQPQPEQSPAEKPEADPDST